MPTYIVKLMSPDGVTVSFEVTAVTGNGAVWQAQLQAPKVIGGWQPVLVLPIA